MLQARGVTKTFPGVLALDDVDFHVYRGQVNVVVGENGAGKSTLMNLLAGVYSPDAGKILLGGRQVTFSDTLQAQRSGIAIIHQELNLIPHLSVAENIFLGREFLTPLGLIDYRRMHREAAGLLARLDTPLDPQVPVAGLRVGQQQVVEIAKALSQNAGILIMDEPTSAISDHEVDVLFQLIESLKADGVAIVYISHKLEELFRIGDRITILRDGRLVKSGRMADMHRDEIVRLMVGRDVKDSHKRTSLPAAEEVLRAEHLVLRHPDGTGREVVQDVSLRVRRGEVLGVFGLMGAGRTELLEAIFGLHPGESSGDVFVGGTRVPIRSPRDAIDAGIGLAPEDRKQQALILMMSVQANVSLTCLDKIKKRLLLNNRLETTLAEEYAKRLRIKTPSTRQIVRNLSGGNQQKVILAKWMATDPKVLLLDEPTRGIDVRAKREIHELIDQLTCAGLGIVMVSSELPEILAVSNRILVMAEGRSTAEFDRAQANEEMILKAALPKSA